MAPNPVLLHVIITSLLRKQRQTLNLGTFIHSFLNTLTSPWFTNENKQAKPKNKIKTQRNIPKMVQVTRRQSSDRSPEAVCLLHLTHLGLSLQPQPSEVLSLREGPVTSFQPRASETHWVRRRSTTGASRLCEPPRLSWGRALTWWESRDPGNLARDLCSEHPEVLLVAFEIRRHCGSGVTEPGRSLGLSRGQAE